ncbi:MAG: alkaline phosphatase family protein [Actinomycetota bacterium]
MTNDVRVAVIGIDCGTPQILFDDLKSEVPNIAKLMEGSMHGPLASITPPITVPAWACAMTGKTPGQLGIYGFRNRKDNTYDGLSIATAGAIKETTVWDRLGANDKKSLLIGVPPSFPPLPIEGWRVGCFLTPPSAPSYATPSEVEGEIEEELGGPGRYIFDIPNFRKAGVERVMADVFTMTERRFKVARRLVQNKPWDFFMLCEIASDRLHHVFWEYYDPNHPKYVAGNEFEGMFQKYYRMLDKELGELLAVLPEDVVTIIMSDHGARAMQGGLCFNDWLIQEGYLTLATPPADVIPISKADIDWSKTVAWGDGGYYGRLFLNVAGREPSGIIDPNDYESVRDEMAQRLEAAPGPDGEPLGTKVFKPQDVYPDVRGIAPDLIVYFGDLDWRSVGSVGNPSIYTYENDTGPDGANHDRTGIFVMNGLPNQPVGYTEGMRLVDVGPTLVDIYGLEALEGAQGRSMLQ